MRLENYKEEDILKVLPCKPGDTLWFETYKNNGREFVGIQPHKIKDVFVDFLCDGGVLGVKIPIWMIGTSVFLSEEEAERAWAEKMRKDEEK